MEIFFDQYQRYKNTQIIIDSIRNKNEKFKILEVGANEHKNLEKFLPQDEVIYLDIELPEELKNDPKYILGDATAMDFSDNSFDIIVALDVFEHIPPDRREKFLKEVNRVASSLFIIAAPFKSDEVVLAEKRVNKFYKILNGAEHRWLIEHIENGLPNIQETFAFLENEKINYEFFKHGNVEIWEEIMYMEFLSNCNMDFLEYYFLLNEHYNKLIFENDYCDNAYRTFIIGNKSNKKINIEKRNNVDKAKSFILFIQNAFFTVYNEYKNKINMREMLEENKRKLNYLQIFGDNDKQQGDLFYIENVKNGAKIFVSSEISNSKILRIDPLDMSCIIKVNNIIIKYSDGMEEEITNKINTNADFLLENNVYIITNNDPQIHFKSEKNIIYVKIDIDILIADEYMTIFAKKKCEELFEKEKNFSEIIKNLNLEMELKNKEISSLNNKNEELNSKNRELSKNIKNFQNTISELTDTINSIKNSTSWKVTEPIRKIKQKMH